MPCFLCSRPNHAYMIQAMPRMSLALNSMEHEDSKMHTTSSLLQELTTVLILGQSERQIFMVS